jgi:Protein of unknown function (DUF4232)
MRLPAFPSGLIGVAAITCITALVATFTSSPAVLIGAAVASTTRQCATSGLVIWLDTEGSGTAGSRYYKLEFTNLSRGACHLLGYPGVSAVDLGGHQLGSAADRDHFDRPRLVRLAMRATATAVLRIVEADNFPRSSCHQVTAAGLRVFPPDGTASKLIPFPFRACSRAGLLYLSVRALQKP